MALTSTLGSPGIEIREVDNSYRLDSSTATTVYIPGFAAQGPVEQVMSISSISDFETIYGTPTNAAERYFYYTVKAVLDGAGTGTTVLCSRLPYGSGQGDTVSNAYTLLAYPAVPVIKKKHILITDAGSITDEKEYTFKTTPVDFDKYIFNEIGKKTVVKKTTTTNADGTTTTTYSNDTIDGISKKEEEEGIASLFRLTAKNFEGDAVSPDIFDYSFILDGDNDFIVESGESKFEAIQNLRFLQPLDAEGNAVEILQLPKLTSKLSDSDIKAPVLVFGKYDEEDAAKTEGYATGVMSIEHINNTLKLCLSYTIFSGDYSQKSAGSTSTLSQDDKKMGSFFATLTYNISKAKTETEAATIWDSITDDTNSVMDFTALGLIPATEDEEWTNLVKVSAFERAASYQGQSTTDLNGWNPYPTTATSNTNVPNEKLDTFDDNVTYIIGSPATFQISLSEYYKLITGESLKWSRRPYTFTQPQISASDVTNKATCYETAGDKVGTPSLFGLYEAIGHSAFIVINTSRSIINSNFEGYYLGITDNMFVNPSDDYTYNAITDMKITTKFFEKDNIIGLLDDATNTADFQSLSTNRLSFYLDSNYQGSISRVLTRNISSMDISGTEYDDTISMGLFKITKSGTSSDILKLNYSLREKYNWSFGKTRVKSSTASTIPVSYFAENVTEGSSNLSILINPFISSKAFVDTNGAIHGKMRVYGTKLVSNLDKFETKYLLRDYVAMIPNTVDSTNSNVSAAMIPKVAQSSIESWKSIVKQAGVTPELIKNEIVNDTTNFFTFQPLNAILPFGTYTSATNSNKIIGSLPIKLQRALELVENDEEYPDIDIILEGGLGTIYVNSAGNEISSESAYDTLLVDEENTTPIDGESSTTSNVFDENLILTGMEDMRTGRSSLSDEAQKVIEDYNAVQGVFLRFADSMANGGRGDTFYISDVPRGILIKGRNTKVTNLFGTVIESNAYDFGETVNHSFPTSIYYPIKHTFDTVVSSYTSTYAQWVKVLDNFSGEKVWIPVSGYIAANMAATDTTYGPWYAAAGLRRGVITGVLDYALSPNISQRTDLYKICINSVPKIPNYGVTIWGIRTMSKAASAFDQNTCRRTFLYMEKKVKQTLRYYIFEPNTSYTRLQIVNDIDPFLEKIKNAGGIYAYTLVCDTSNNTPDVINNGDLAVSIAAAPTRTAENIVVEFTANKYTEEISAAESLT